MASKKYHQAVRGEFAGVTFTTSLCDAGRSGERLVADIYDLPRHLQCAACRSRIPWAGSHEPVVVDALTLSEN